MSYTQLSSFEGSGKKASVYLVCCVHDADRKFILEKLAASLQGEPKRFDSADLSEDILPLTRELNLFGAKKILLSLDTQVQEEGLARYLQSPAPDTYLLLGCKTSKKCPGAACLDLIHEKPWEREKRLLESLRGQAMRAEKSVAADLLLKLMNQVGTDWRLLESELEKLVAFVGSRREITLADLEEVSCRHKEKSTWEMAEEVIWGKGVSYFPSLDTSEALTLIGALRFQIQLGWQLCSVPLPAHIKPYQVQKYGKLAQAKPLKFFEKATLQLFEVEKLLKSTPIDPRLLLLRFAAELTCR